MATDDDDVESYSNFSEPGGESYDPDVLWSNDPEKAYLRLMLNDKHQEDSLIGESTLGEIMNDESTIGNSTLPTLENPPGGTLSGRGTPYKDVEGEDGQHQAAGEATSPSRVSSGLTVPEDDTLARIEPDDGNTSAVGSLDRKVSAMMLGKTSISAQMHQQNGGQPPVAMIPRTPKNFKSKSSKRKQQKKSQFPVVNVDEEVVAQQGGEVQGGKGPPPSFIFVTPGQSSAVKTKEKGSAAAQGASKGSGKTSAAVEKSKKMNIDSSKKQEKAPVPTNNSSWTGRFYCRVAIVLLLVAVIISMVLLVLILLERLSGGDDPTEVVAGPAPSYPTINPDFTFPPATFEPTDSPPTPTSAPSTLAPSTTSSPSTVAPTVTMITSSPTSQTNSPTVAPTTESPTNPPVVGPTEAPTKSPTGAPSNSPTGTPTTTSPTITPTRVVETQVPTVVSSTQVPTQGGSTASPTQGGSTASPTTSRPPTTQDIPEEIVTDIIQLSPESEVSIRDTNSPQFKALEWAVTDARSQQPNGGQNLLRKRKLELDTKLLQRWVLATVYFSTNGEDWDYERDIMLPWLSSGNECLWHSLECSSDGTNEITSITLRENNLIGQIPPEIHLLSSLEFLHFNSNQLTGTIPTTIGRLKNLGTGILRLLGFCHLPSKRSNFLY